MRRALLSIMVAAGKAGCNQSPDGYTFEDKRTDFDTVAMTVVEHPSIYDLRKSAPAEALRANEKLMAWSKLRGATCEIHVVDPEVKWSSTWLGHEAAHCVWGEWHPKQNKERK